MAALVTFQGKTISKRRPIMLNLTILFKRARGFATGCRLLLLLLLNRPLWTRLQKELYDMLRA